MSEQSLSVIFGKIVRAKREAAGFSQEELAEFAAIHPTYVGLVERGKRNPTLDISDRIAKALGCSLAELLGVAEATRKGEPKPTRLRK